MLRVNTNIIVPCFDQQVFKTYIKLEDLLIRATRRDIFHAEHNEVVSIYRKEFDDNTVSSTAGNIFRIL